MRVSSTKQGVPSWAELATTDEAGALSFYSGLFGWDDRPQPMGEGMGAYHMQMLGDDTIAGLAAQQPVERERGIPPHWSVFIAVDNVDETAARVPAAGGMVLAGPFDVMDSGRMAIVADPTGAAVGLWQAKAHPGFTRKGEPNTVTWCELVTDDPGKASTFYTTLLGVPAEEQPMGDQPPYVLIGPAGEQGAGVVTRTPEMGQMPNVWGVYFEVTDADAACAKAKALGGSVFVGPTEFPSGRWAMLADPQGAVFGVMQTANPAG